MPVKFDSIRTEHDAVRESVGIFDVSHMGEVYVSGLGATDLMNELTTNDVASLDSGKAQYSCILREDGVVVDDTVVYDLPNESGYLFIPNAGHDELMTERWRTTADELGLDVTVSNRTLERGMVAVQGPDAIERVETATDDDVADLGRFSARETTVDGADCLVARTGYTGEDGVEIVFDTTDSETVWSAFDDVQPCGLGARDTLRLEAGLLLSGQDFHPEDEPRNPIEADLDFVVSDDKESFVGKEAVDRAREDGVDERIVGVELTERGVPRHGCPMVADGARIGHVTSGTVSPTLEVPIAFGYVDTAYADEGTSVGVEIRDRVHDATVVGKRFLQRHRSY